MKNTTATAGDTVSFNAIDRKVEEAGHGHNHDDACECEGTHEHPCTMGKCDWCSAPLCLEHVAKTTGDHDQICEECHEKQIDAEGGH